MTGHLSGTDAIFQTAFEFGPIATVVVSGDHVVALNHAAREFLGDGSKLPAELSTLADASDDLTATVGFDTQRGDGEPVKLEAHTAHLPDGSTIIQLVDVTESAERASELAFRAEHDPLTGLLNRTAVDAALELLLMAPQDPSRPGAALFCDLDNFKLVNDQHGHLIGDEVLVTIAGRIAATVRRSDAVGRFGGDEFLVVLPQIGIDEARHTASRVVRAIHEPILVGGRTYRVGACVGVVVLDRPASVKEVLAQADAAMYRAKAKLGAERYVVQRLGVG